ncbi:MAG TPA: hypothetical protein VMP08_16265, partial [Anaerolineae bacterium]|nr:hypothetical protein [Anaerolineae bacterium]
PNTLLLGLLNVKYIAAAFPLKQNDLLERAVFSTTHVYENVRVLPRAFLVSKIDVADSPEAAGAWLATRMISPSTSAVVEGLPYPFELPVAPGAVEIASWSPDHIVLRADGPGWLVLSEIVAPDWVAAVDGEATEILATDLTLRGIYVPWGKHEVTFDYQPRRVYAGVLISMFSLVAVIGTLIAKKVVRHNA